MDAFQFDTYTSYSSDSSTPRTPSPPSDLLAALPPAHFKVELDSVNIFQDPMSDDHTVAPEGHHPWTGMNSQPLSLPFNNSRGSLLQELYDQPNQQDPYFDAHAEPLHVGSEWQQPQQRVDAFHQETSPMRRATFPYVRQDRDDGLSYPSQNFILRDSEPFSGPYSSRQDTVYGEPLMMEQSPQLLPFGGQPDHLQNGRYDLSSSLSSSPASSYHDFDPMESHVKMEESAPVIVPSQLSPYHHQVGSSPMHPVTYLSPHTGLPIRHTDDASSKETPTLRRRCFNCSQTEPPSWRRSTLNPGKIVCNKCGLYERTHLRPRPLRFDELRTGNKSRKQSKTGGSPQVKGSPLVKKEELEPMPRRSSVSSSSGSIHSSSDWDDSVSVYSSSGGSGPPSSFNSPATTSFSLPLDQHRSSQSPPQDGGIRLPNAPLSDIASFQSGHSPRHSATTPDYGSPSNLEPFRRSSLPADMVGSETTGWQSVPLDMSPGKAGKSRKSIVA